MERRLAAILAADVEGYSRLMGADEEATLATLNVYREIIDRLVVDLHGRVFGSAGDSVIAEFASPVEAVRCAVEIQQEIEVRNATLPEDRRMRFRIGVNLGDVMAEGNNLFGDGVNVAARLEGLAKAGGICVSGTVFDHVRNKVGAAFEDLGERQVKNIPEPIRVYRVAAGMVEEDRPASTFEASIGLDFSVPDYPSIAVLPFTVMSADPEQEFFADGMAEDIITALSKISSLLVVARNSSFTYKGQAVDVKQVSREQGVRYVLEGSVRKAGNRVRVTAQLIDATTGHHIWAERYDRNLEDIFAVQDEITHEVVVALDVRLSAGEQARTWSSGTKNLEAWGCVRQGMELINRSTPEAIREARKLCERALELDPDYAFAWVAFGWTHHHGVDVSVGQAPEENLETALGSAMDCANRALELDPSCADAHALLGFCHLSRRGYETAIAMSNKAVELAPGNAGILGNAAMLQLKSGRPEQSLELIKKAMRLCPVYPVWFCSLLGNTYRFLGRNESAITAFESAIKRGSEFLALHVGLASILGELGRKEDAKKSVSEILRIDPGFSIEKYMSGLIYSDPAVTTRFKDGLQKSGLPD
jgi:adenylate cyclase